jgi:predicted dehydrogenase
MIVHPSHKELLAMSDLRIGVLGTCGRGGLARQAHNPGDGSAVVACCDIKPKCLDAAKEWYGDDVLTTRNMNDLLAADLDAIMICTPDFLHEEQAVTFLEAGIPVYLEKPMAITIEGCDRILAAAKKTGTKLFVGHNMRYMTIIRKMKALIDQGAIGEVRSIWCRHFISYGGDAYFRDWHSEREKSTGMLLQKGAHDIDVMHWLTGCNSIRVSAFGNLSVYNRCDRRKEDEPGSPAFVKDHWPPLEQTGFSPKMDIEDQTTLIMEMENGVLGAYLQCHFSPDSCRNYTVIGTEGRIENIGDGPRSPIFVWNRRSDNYSMIGDEVYYGDTVSSGSHGGADPLIVREFIQYVRGEIETTTATPEAARMSVATGCQGTKSLRNGGQPYDVPPIS